MEGPLDNGVGNWWSDEIEPFLDTEVGAPRTVEDELERDTVLWAWRALAAEFVLETGDAGVLAL